MKKQKGEENKKGKYRREDNHYRLQIIHGDNVANVSVYESGKTYRDNDTYPEPKGVVTCEYKDKKYDRGKILRKFGLWLEPVLGINLEQLRKQRLLG